VVSGAFRLEPAATQPIERDAIYRCRRLRRDVIEICSLVPHSPPELSRSRGSDGGARGAPNPYNDHARGFSIRARIEKRWNRRAKPVGSSWRVDETFIRTRRKMRHLFRAVDRDGKTVDSRFQVGRGIAVAMALFRKALASCTPRWPRKIESPWGRQKNKCCSRAKTEADKWRAAGCRACRLHAPSP
jgi:DDE domain